MVNVSLPLSYSEGSGGSVGEVRGELTVLDGTTDDVVLEVSHSDSELLFGHEQQQWYHACLGFEQCQSAHFHTYWYDSQQQFSVERYAFLVRCRPKRFRNNTELPFFSEQNIL